ncbi:hypothetical protein B0H13DRAFT_2553583, partial [Mycena leptocephala]
TVLQHVHKKITSFRLGYSPQRPYPWRCTTSIVLGSFLLMSALLALINGSIVVTWNSSVPLSAYELDQEFTYRPNDSLPSLPLSYMVPKILQHSPSAFTPQILTVGDTIQLNNSVFSFTIVEAFDMVSAQPVPSFSYYNNPFSSGCDVINMTIDEINKPINDTTFVRDFMVTAGCDVTTFTMIWSGEELKDTTNPAREIFDNFANDLHEFLKSLSLGADGLGWHDRAILPTRTQPPCSLNPARFMAVEGYFRFVSDEGISVLGSNPNSTNFFPAYWIDNSTQAALNLALQNTFQALYHLVRLELGVILPNQIYASPWMYNDSISYRDNSFDTAAFSRRSTSNATLMAEWAAIVHSFNSSDRVPVMLYIRPAPRLKPLGSAITSVFVSTFAMLSVLWTTFNIIAAAFAERSDPKGKTSVLSDTSTMVQDKEAQQIMLEEWNESEASLFHPEKTLYSAQHTTVELHLEVEKLQLASERTQSALESTQRALERTQLALERMRRSFRDHGIPQEVDDTESISHGFNMLETGWCWFPRARSREAEVLRLDIVGRYNGRVFTTVPSCVELPEHRERLDRGSNTEKLSNTEGDVNCGVKNWIIVEFYSGGGRGDNYFNIGQVDRHLLKNKA